MLVPTNEKKLDLPPSGVSATPVNPPVGERPRQPGVFHSIMPCGVSAFASLRGVPLAPSLLEKAKKKGCACTPSPLQKSDIRPPQNPLVEVWGHACRPAHA